MTSSTASVTIVGDALLDRDVTGTVERICPDAPVPVFDERHVASRPGGAALAAVLAASSGTPTTLVTAIGHDDPGHELRGLLKAAGVALVDVGLDGPTPEKVRLRADGHSVLRLDRGGHSPLAGRHLTTARRAIAAASAVLVSDYGQGITHFSDLMDHLRTDDHPVVWDPHPNGAKARAGCALVTPNRVELGRLADPPGPPPGDFTAVTAMARELVHRWGIGAVSVTLGEVGVLLVRGSGAPQAIPVPPASGDPCGAGDAFAVHTTCALAGATLLPDAVERGAVAASSFVAGGDVLVATGGCFDLLHAGHVSLLHAARSLGDRLVVLLNSDRSVARLKGPDRPIQDEHDRRAVLLALGCVDDVVVFDEDTPATALERLRPQVWVKGGDYSGLELPESEVLSRWGGQAVTVPYLSGRSTTRLIMEARRAD